MSFSRSACAIVLLSCSASAFAPAPQQQAQTPGDSGAPVKSPQEDSEAPAFSAGYSFFPVPNISVGKNEGTTLGVIGAFLYADERGDVASVFSAGVGYRSLVGANLFLDYRANPTPYSFIEFFGSKAVEVEEEYQAFFEDRKVDKGRFSMLFEFDRSVITTYRFYGRADDAPLSDESVYTGAAYRTRLYFGPNLTDKLTLQGTFRFGHTNIENSLITDLPQTLDAFPNEPGIQTGNIWALGLSLTYEGRDNVNTPTSGYYGNLFGEAARYATDDTNVPYYRVGAEGKKLWPWTEEANFVTVLRLKCQFLFGNEIPFYELSSLGGDKTLRGYGAQRFTNNDMLLLNLEQRIRVAQVSLFGVKGDVQIAPFVDIGEVFTNFNNDIIQNGADGFHYSYGIGLRGVVSPYVVGRIDVGFSPEGSAVAVGIDYPF